ncbi:MAG: 30S ribosomal protein S9 [Patescibacteria group bacterium]
MATTKKQAQSKAEVTTSETVKKKVPATTVKKPVAKKTVKKTEKKAVEIADQEVVVESAEIAAAEAVKSGSFIPALGRRKTSIARVRLIKNGKGLVTVNGKKMETYFTTYELREDVLAPLKAVGQADAVDVSAKVTGGGIRGQAQAIRLGISRALIVLNPTFRTVLKKLGYMTRDPRKRQRKMFGKKSARRSPQWSKR